MTFNELIKTAEGLVVLVGLFLTLAFGKLFAILTAAGYLLINIQGWWPKVLSVLTKIWKSLFGTKEG